MKTLVLLAALPLAAQMDMRMEVRMQSPSPTVISSMRFVFQDNILRIETGPSILINNIAEGKIFIGNPTDKIYVEATQAEFEQLGKKAVAGAPTGLNATKLDAPAAPPYEWNGQKLQGKACRYKIEIPNVPSGGYEQTVIVYGTPISGNLAAFHAAQRRAGFTSPVPGGDSLTAAMTDCFVTDLFPVRTEFKMVMPQLKMETVMVMEAVSVKQGPVDPALLRMPVEWKRDTTTSMRAALEGISRRATPPPPARPVEPEVTKESLLASIDALRRGVEAGNWDEARTHTYTISSALMRKAEKEKPPLSKQLEDIEAKLSNAGDRYRVSLMADAAEMALKLGRLDKVRTHAQAIVDTPQSRPGLIDDELHRAHTLLGLLALRRGDKDAAFAHLDSAGKTGRITSYLGPRTELAEALATAGERLKVADYLDTVSLNVRDEDRRRMYQTAAKNLRAGQPAYFSGDRYGRYEFPK